MSRQNKKSKHKILIKFLYHKANVPIKYHYQRERLTSLLDIRIYNKKQYIYISVITKYNIYIYNFQNGYKNTNNYRNKYMKDSWETLKS